MTSRYWMISGSPLALEEQGGVGAVEHRLLGRALQPLAARRHEDGENVRLIGGEGRARAAQGVGGGTPGGLAEGPADLAPAGALGTAIEGSPGPARRSVAGHEVVEPGARPGGVVDIAQQRQVGQDQPGRRLAGDGLDHPARSRLAGDGRDVARRLLGHGLETDRKVGADLDAAEADAEGRAAREADIDHVGGLERQEVGRQEGLEGGALEPGAVEAALGDAFCCGGIEGQGQLEAGLAHASPWSGRPAWRSGCPADSRRPCPDRER